MLALKKKEQKLVIPASLMAVAILIFPDTYMSFTGENFFKNVNSNYLFIYTILSYLVVGFAMYCVLALIKKGKNI